MDTTMIVLAVVAANLVVTFLVLRRFSGSAGMERKLGEEMRAEREASERTAAELRREVSDQIRTSGDSLTKTIGEMGKMQVAGLKSATDTVKSLADGNEKRLDGLRDTIDRRIAQLQEGNEKKLDEMRATVDEKLQGTLEQRLGEAFKQVGDRLEAVQRGLGEMQELATGVGDLKRVLTNVKARGTWGEVQLGALLEQVLTPEQYDRNVATREGSAENVEFAVRLPGAEDDGCVWLPIDSKFPQEDYLRLRDAADKADRDAVAAAHKDLLRAVKTSAKEISEKYINPPATTDFAIMFLPTEGLYAEVVRSPGLIEQLQQSYRVVVAGPTTLTATLSSLRMGFRTLAIEKRSSEVWKVLAAVKSEFGKFGGVLDKVKRQLATASKTIDETGVRTRQMARRLRDVEKLPGSEAEQLLGVDDAGMEEAAAQTEGDDGLEAGASGQGAAQADSGGDVPDQSGDAQASVDEKV